MDQPTFVCPLYKECVRAGCPARMDTCSARRAPALGPGEEGAPQEAMWWLAGGARGPLEHQSHQKHLAQRRASQ